MILSHLSVSEHTQTHTHAMVVSVGTIDNSRQLQINMVLKRWMRHSIITSVAGALHCDTVLEAESVPERLQ